MSAPSSGGGGGAFAMGGGGGAFAGSGGKMQGMGGGGGSVPGKSVEDEAWGMLNDWGKSAASLASKASETVKATTSDLASNVGAVDLNSIGSAAYDRAERARKAAADMAAAQSLDEVGGKLTQTTSEAASMFGSFLGKAVSVASEGLKDTASVVGGTAGGGWWGQQQQQSQQTGGGGNRTAEELGGTSTDPEGMEVMVGEDEQAYIARRTRLQAEAKARMAAKFGNSGGLGGIASSSAGSGGNSPSAAAQQSTRSQQERVARLSSEGSSKEDKWEDDDGWGDDGWGEKSPAPAPSATTGKSPAPAPSRSAIDEQAAAVAAMSGESQPNRRYEPVPSR
jgi:hypothetical protein